VISREKEKIMHLGECTRKVEYLDPGLPVEQEELVEKPIGYQVEPLNGEPVTAEVQHKVDAQLQDALNS
jgi:hypothetical protein